MAKKAFTLIELSIVLVIIGLIVGGVLVGRDLISAAAARGQVTQIGKLNAAVNTFKGKYNGYLPGDIPEPYASQFGFAARGAYAGMGDGDGTLLGKCDPGFCTCGFCPINGEATSFWVDLSTAKLIDGSFTTALPTDVYRTMTTTNITKYLPAAALGNGNYIYIYGTPSALFYQATGVDNGAQGGNYFAISAVTSGNFWSLFSSPGMNVKTAQNIDQKMDDGLPQSGKITANYLNYTTKNFSTTWAAGGGAEGAGGGGGYNVNPTTVATPGSSTTCYDNNNVSGAVQQYSVSQNNGNGMNCALSFQFQ